MELLYIALPAALLLGAIFLAAFVWASKRGQYDDLDTPSIRMLHDDEPMAGVGTPDEESGLDSKQTDRDSPPASE